MDNGGINDSPRTRMRANSYAAKDDRRHDSPSPSSRIFSFFSRPEHSGSSTDNTPRPTSSSVENQRKRIPSRRSDIQLPINEIIVQSDKTSHQSDLSKTYQEMIKYYQKAEFAKYRGVICEIMRNKNFGYKNVLYALLKEREDKEILQNPIYNFKNKARQYAKVKFHVINNNADNSEYQQEYIDNYVDYQTAKICLIRKELSSSSNQEPLISCLMKEIIKKYPSENLVTMRERIEQMDDYDYISTVYANKPGNGGLRSSVGSFSQILIDNLEKHIADPPPDKSRGDMSKYHLTNKLRLIYNDLVHAEGILSQISNIYSGKALLESNNFKSNHQILLREDTPRLSDSGSCWRNIVKNMDHHHDKHFSFMNEKDFNFDNIQEDGGKMIYDLSKAYLSTLKYLIQNIDYLNINFLNITLSAENGNTNRINKTTQLQDLLLNINSELMFIFENLTPFMIHLI